MPKSPLLRRKEGKGRRGPPSPFPTKIWWRLWKLTFLFWDPLRWSLVPWSHQGTREPGECNLSLMALWWGKSTSTVEEGAMPCCMYALTWEGSYWTFICSQTPLGFGFPPFLGQPPGCSSIWPVLWLLSVMGLSHTASTECPGCGLWPISLVWSHTLRSKVLLRRKATSLQLRGLLRAYVHFCLVS